jgi:hypothetical protein
VKEFAFLGPRISAAAKTRSPAASAYGRGTGPQYGQQHLGKSHGCKEIHVQWRRTPANPCSVKVPGHVGPAVLTSTSSLPCRSAIRPPPGREHRRRSGRRRKPTRPQGAHAFEPPLPPRDQHRVCARDPREPAGRSRTDAAGEAPVISAVIAADQPIPGTAPRRPGSRPDRTRTPRVLCRGFRAGTHESPHGWRVRR